MIVNVLRPTVPMGTLPIRMPSSRCQGIIGAAAFQHHDADLMTLLPSQADIESGFPSHLAKIGDFRWAPHACKEKVELSLCTPSKSL